jgi:hypothetical protein
MINETALISVLYAAGALQMFMLTQHIKIERNPHSRFEVIVVVELLFAVFWPLVTTYILCYALVGGFRRGWIQAGAPRPSKKEEDK